MRECALSNRGWHQLVDSLKLQVSFAECSLFYRALLQIETYNFKEPINHSHPISIMIVLVFSFCELDCGGFSFGAF